jgi:hypothetical protein
MSSNPGGFLWEQQKNIKIYLFLAGKTAAFSLPFLERLLYRPRRVPTTRVLVLTPTRELAVQVPR